MEPSNDNYIVIQRQFRVLNPRPEDSILVSLHEWDSLTQRVADCKIPVRPRIIIQCITLALGLIGLILAPVAYFAQLPAWVFSVGIGFCSAGLGGGFSLGISGAAIAKEQYAAIGRFASELTHLRRKALLDTPKPETQPEATLS